MTPPRSPRQASTTEVELVVYGAGPMGLGLVAAQAADAGLRVSAAARAGSGKPTTRLLQDRLAYQLLLDDVPRTVHLNHVYISDNPRSRTALQRHLVESPYVIAMTSSRHGQSAFAELIRDAARERPRKERGFLAVVPCENNVHPDVARLSRLGASTDLVYIDSMVDRICRTMKVSGSRGQVEVDAQAAFEWVATLPRPTSKRKAAALEVVAQCLRRMDITFVSDSDLELARQRKRMILNTSLLALAIRGRLLDVETLGEFFDRELETGFTGADWAQVFVAEALRALLEAQPMTRARADRVYDFYTSRILDDRKDEQRRLLERLSPSTIVTFITEVQDRLGEVYRLLQTALGTGPARSTAVADTYRLVLSESARVL